MVRPFLEAEIAADISRRYEVRLTLLPVAPRTLKRLSDC